MKNQHIRDCQVRIKEELIDKCSDEFISAANVAIHTVFQDLKGWISRRYSIFKSSSTIDTKKELQN